MALIIGLSGIAGFVLGVGVALFVTNDQRFVECYTCKGKGCEVCNDSGKEYAVASATYWQHTAEWNRRGWDGARRAIARLEGNR